MYFELMSWCLYLRTPSIKTLDHMVAIETASEPKSVAITGRKFVGC
jgi:hypothetical protein